MPANNFGDKFESATYDNTGGASSSHTPHKKRRHHSSKNKHTARNIVIVLCAFLITMVATACMFINNFLNKIDYMNAETDTTLIADPDFDESVDLPDEYDKYEKDAQNNYGTKGIYSEENVLNVLICGIDMGDVKDNLYYGRSDSMMILSINNNDDTLRLASLSRAVYVKIPNHRSARLSAAHSYGGPSLLIETIENNYKIRIDNFITVNFEAFKNIIDIFGGIDIYLTDQEAAYVAKSLNNLGLFASYSYKGAGTYHLDGETALMYARARKIDSDRERTGRQRKVLEKIYDKVKNMSASNLMKVANQVLPLVTTDFSKSEILSQCTKIPKYMTWNTQETVIPDKSSAIVNIEGVENGVLLVDWDETIAYSKSFLYPLFTEKETTE